MSQTVINNGDTGLVSRTSINDNDSELYSIVTSSDYYIVPEGESLNNAITNAGAIENIIINHEVALTSDLITNKNLVINKGGIISGAYTLTHTGRIDAGFYQIYDSTLTLDGITSSNTVIVDWWGVDTTGVSNSIDAFDKALDRIDDGFLFTISKGIYLLTSNTYLSREISDSITFDFNYATLIFDGLTYLGIGRSTSREGFSSNPFAEDFVKGDDYIVVNDMAAWEALAAWGNSKISITTTEETSPGGGGGPYYDALSIDIDRFADVGGEERMYFKYPCPRDFDVNNVTYPLREYDSRLVRYWPKVDDITFKNVTIKNGQVSIRAMSNLTIQNVSFFITDALVSTQNRALKIERCDNVHIDNYYAENYRKSANGYGIQMEGSSRIDMANTKFVDCRHAVSFSGLYTDMGYDLRINNIELISTGKDYSANNIDTHGNTIGLIVDGVRAINTERVLSTRSGSAIIRNVYAYGITAAPFEFTNVGAIDFTICSVVNVILENCQIEIVEIDEWDGALAIFENVVSDQNQNFLENDDSAFGTILVNDCYVNNVPATSSEIINQNGGTITTLYINNVLIP